MDQKEIIRREYFLSRKSMREIARELHHGRAVIRKAIYDPGIPAYKRNVPAPERAIGALVTVIQQWLQEDKQRPTKQRHTAKRIYERLRGGGVWLPGFGPDGKAGSASVKGHGTRQSRAPDL